MTTDAEKLRIARDKLTRVFRYLEALNQAPQSREASDSHEPAFQRIRLAIVAKSQKRDSAGGSTGPFSESLGPSGSVSYAIAEVRARRFARLTAARTAEKASSPATARAPMLLLDKELFLRAFHTMRLKRRRVASAFSPWPWNVAQPAASE